MAKRSPKSDLGTVLLHWVLVIFVVVQIGTGLRIASHEPSLGWLANLDFVLPRENLWYWHLVGALGFTAVFASYIAYVIAARLGQRSRVDRSRLSSLWRGGSARWTTLGVLVLWAGFGAFAAEIISGSLLYLGQAGWAISVHRHAVWFCIVFPIAHVLCHFLAGGAEQVLRILRPARLVIPPPPPDVLTMLADHVQLVDSLKQGNQPTPEDLAAISELPPATGRKPLLTSLIIGGSVVALGLATQIQTGRILVVPSIESLGQFGAPVIDGDVSDAVWAMVPPLGLLTSQGANFKPERQSWIEIKAVRDQSKIYISVIWEDQTRSLRHLPLLKRQGGWQVVRSVTPSSREEIFYEDQFSLLLSAPTVPIVGPAIHLSPRPLDGYPPSSTGRGMHYLENGAVSDVWLWRASHVGPTAMLEDARFGQPLAPTPGQLSGAEPYRGGYAPDEGPSCFADNHALSQSPEQVVVPLRLPKDISWMALGVDDAHASADISDPEDARYWMSNSESEPYTPDLDQRFPEGSIIPGIIMTCVPSGDRADLSGQALWAAGRWTLEVVRALDTNSTQDVPIASGTLVWLAAFDHAATRHTRHIRPIELHLP